MLRLFTVLLVALSLLACSGAKKKPDVHGQYLESIQGVSFSAQWGKRFAELGSDRFAKLYPVLENGIVYSAGREGSLSATELKTGNVVWQTQNQRIFSAGPTIGAQCLFVATRNAELLCADKISGKLVWKNSLSSAALAPVAIGKGVVIVQTGDGKISGLSESDGGRLWTYERRLPTLSLRGTAKPLIVDDTVLAGFANGKLVALSIHDGKTLWENSVSTPRGRTELERMVDIDGMFHYDGNAIYVVNYRGRVAALTLESGRLLWTRDLSSFLGLNLDDKYLYITDDEGRVWAMDKDNGATLWMQDRLSNRAVTAPVVDQNRVIVGDRDGSVYWLNKSDGALKAKLTYRDIAEATGIINPADVGRPEPHPALIYHEDLGVVNASVVEQGNIVVSYRNGVVAALTANW